jgi:acetyl esterase
MPLDPEAKVFLDQLASAGGPALHELPVPEVRQLMLDLMGTKGDREAVGSVSDRTIPGPSGPVPVRVYAAREEGPLPVLLYFHGGGWVGGDIESYDATCRAMTNAAGCVLVSVDYRLAPEHKFPAAPEDCFAALGWVRANASTVGGDASRLAIGGDSAGGNLTAVVTQMSRDRGEPPAALQLLVYPVTDRNFETASYRDNADGYLLTRDAMIWFWNHYLRKEADAASALASPLRATDLRGLPPAFVLTAEFDPLRDEGEAYAARLHEAGVPVTLRRYSGMIHGFFGLSSVFSQGRQAIMDAGLALRAAFGTVAASGSAARV